MGLRHYSLFHHPITHKIENTLFNQFWNLTEIKEEIMTCVQMQQVFNLQKFNKMSLSVHTYGQLTTQKRDGY